jgi:lipopolysaccharide transport system ATP-binding protein
MLAISVENVSKVYRLGEVNRSQFFGDLRQWFRKKLNTYHLVGSSEGDFDKHPNNKDVFHALKDVTFDIHQGETVGIIGANGAGKSTLLKLISRITAPTSGSIKINGRIGSLLEVGTGFHPDLTGRDNVFMNGAILGMNRGEVASKLDDIVSFSGVAKFIDTPVKHYSSGMFVRLAFSVAAFLEPEILIVDEVLSVGDQQFQNRCIQRLQDIIRDGRTVIFVSHGAGQIRKLCTRAICLQHGQIFCDDEANRALEQYQAAQLSQGSIAGSKQGTSSMAEVVFKENERPGDEIVSIISGRLLDHEGRIVEKSLTSCAFRLEFEYQVHQGGFPLRPACIVSDELGNILFWTGDVARNAAKKPAAKGVYSARLDFPARFFSPGRLLFTFGVGEDTATGDSHALASDALSILLDDDANDLLIRGAYKGSLPGFFRPLMKWTTAETSIASAK